MLFLLCSFVYLDASAQETDKSVQNSRIDFLSKQYSIPKTDATKIVLYIDSTTNAMNKIFHDSTLTSKEKVKRLTALEKGKAVMIKKIVPEKADILLNRSPERSRKENQ